MDGSFFLFWRGERSAFGVVGVGVRGVRCEYLDSMALSCGCGELVYVVLVVLIWSVQLLDARRIHA